MTNTRFLPAQYLDPDTQRRRWAVLSPSHCWYFPQRYGYKEARALANRLNREVLKCN